MSFPTRNSFGAPQNTQPIQQQPAIVQQTANAFPGTTAVTTPQQQPQQAVAGDGQKQSNFIQASSLNYYDNRNTEWKNEKHVINFKEEQAFHLFHQLEAVLHQSRQGLNDGVEGPGITVNFTYGKRGQQLYPSGGFTIGVKKEKRQQGFTPRR